MSKFDLVREKSPYKDRYPKLFLIGNPEKLGYDNKSEEWADLWNYVITLANVNEQMPSGLAVGWWNPEDGAFYVHEAPLVNVNFSEQGKYNIFQKLMSNNPKKLLQVSPPITTYAIPAKNSPEYIKLMLSVKLWKNIKEQMNNYFRHLPDVVEGSIEDMKRSISWISF